MPGGMKKTLLIALVFGASWGGALWYWRATKRMPAPEDLALYLLALLLVIWLGVTLPGEGAAGLLLADAHQAQAVEGAPVILLHTVAEARRHDSADQTRRADSALLGTLTEKVLARADAQAAQVAMIVADTGHRTSRVLELMGLATAALPQLDEDADVIRVGAASGTCGAVPFMTALALARHHALERDAPVLCISNEDAYRRCAALIRPAVSLS